MIFQRERKREKERKRERKKERKKNNTLHEHGLGEQNIVHDTSYCHKDLLIIVEERKERRENKREREKRKEERKEKKLIKVRK